MQQTQKTDKIVRTKNGGLKGHSATCGFIKNIDAERLWPSDSFALVHQFPYFQFIVHIKLCQTTDVLSLKNESCIYDLDDPAHVKIVRVKVLTSDCLDVHVPTQ